MKLSNKTASIMKSLSGINIGMVIPKGKMIQVASEPRDILARYMCEEDFPIQYGIADVPNFIQTIGLFDNPDLDFKTSHLDIKSGRNKCAYHYITNPDYISHSLWLIIEDDDYMLDFSLTEEDITNIQKASNIMTLDRLIFSNEDGKLVCNVVSSAGESDNTYGIELCDIDKALDFEMIMRVAENFRFFAGDYSIRIAKVKGTLVFCANNDAIDLKYQIAMDRDSYFN